MFGPVGSVSISLGSVVLDRPDQTGLYIAKDLAGGWAYLIVDADGDKRFRGQGVCEGGLDVALRCAFLSATNCVPDCLLIKIVVETRQAHRAMVQLASGDTHVVAAIAGRPVAIMTRPQERSSFHVRSAAERAASTALRDREHAEWHAAHSLANVPAEAGINIDGGIGVVGLLHRDPCPTQGWRVRHGPGSARPPIVNSDARAVANPTSSAPVQLTSVRRLLRPIVDGARDGLAAAGVLPPRRKAPVNRAVIDWLKDFDTRVANVRSDLRDVGA
jgi:hypothetical protein